MTPLPANWTTYLDKDSMNQIGAAPLALAYYETLRAAPDFSQCEVAGK